MADPFENPNLVVFQGPTELQPGDVELHGLRDTVGKLFGRTLEDVKADWQRITAQVGQMMESTAATSVKGFGLETLTIRLGFNGHGRLVFIADAGIEASVEMAFKRV
jgi:hypothetical protein